MRKFDLSYGDVNINVNKEQSYDYNRRQVLKQVFRKNTCSVLWDKLSNTFDEPYAEKVITMIKNEQITLVDESTFPYADYSYYNSYIDANDITYNGYLKKTKIVSNGINHFISEVESCVMDKFTQGYENIYLYNFVFVLALHLAKFNNSDIMHHVKMTNLPNKSNLFYGFVKSLLWSLTIKNNGNDYQGSNIFLYDKAYYEKVQGEYTLPDVKQLYTLDYSLYKEVQETLLDIIGSLNFYKDIKTPNIKVYLSTDNENNVLDLELYEKVCKCRASNIETVYYKVSDEINMNVLSETIIDYNVISGNRVDKNVFEQKLVEYYIDAQTVNQMKRLISTNAKYNNFYLNTKIINVDEDMYDTVKEILRAETKYLCSTYSDNFSFEISIKD